MFNKRIWLNTKKSTSTGNAVAFSGKTKWKGKVYKNIFFQVSDCNVSARLHKTDEDSTYDFILKLKKLRKFLDEFINYLEKHNN